MEGRKTGKKEKRKEETRMIIMAGRKRKEIKMDYFSSYERERECVCVL